MTRDSEEWRFVRRPVSLVAEEVKVDELQLINLFWQSQGLKKAAESSAENDKLVIFTGTERSFKNLQIKKGGFVVSGYRSFLCVIFSDWQQTGSSKRNPLFVSGLFIEQKLRLTNKKIEKKLCLLMYVLNHARIKRKTLSVHIKS